MERPLLRKLEGVAAGAVALALVVVMAYALLHGAAIVLFG